MGFRKHRVADEIRAQLADLLMHGLDDPGIGFVTVTEVRMSPDLRYARVYISVLGGEQRQEEAMAAIRRAQGYLRREIGHRVRLRHTPELAFVLDHTLDDSERIERLLAESRPQPAEGADDDVADGGASNGEDDV